MAESEIRECGREFCTFKAPLSEWKIKAGGVPGKCCEKCCAVFKKKATNKSDESKATDRERQTALVKCPHCNKDLQAGGLKRHIKNNCRVKPADESAD